MTMDLEVKKLPRLYVDSVLALHAPFTLDNAKAHYFRTVLRRQEGHLFRVFNGRDGEYLAEITALSKKDGEAIPQKKIQDQPSSARPLHLLFAPIKKQRMDFLIEKAVELGVTDLHPVITAHCEVRKINPERIQAQIIEAAEQCERMTIPILHDLCGLKEKLAGKLPPVPVLWCAERQDVPLLSRHTGKTQAFLIGPEGGFDDQEIQTLFKQPGITPVSLGNTLYRAETAALLCLAQVHMQN